MKGKSLALLIVSLLLVLGLSAGAFGLWAKEPAPPRRPLAEPVGTAFTYQGRLIKDGNPVTDTCDFQFSLWDAASAGSQVGSTQTKTGITVTDGLFTVGLDFGDGAFQGDARWLKIEVQCPGDPAFVELSPRQELTPAPYALALPGLWTQPNAESPNLIGGYSGNSVTSGVIGATIGGGGASGYYTNQVTQDYGTVGGGINNTAGSYATVPGGGSNTASGQYASVGGGYSNTASGYMATVGGGYANMASGSRATVGGGQMNTASGYMATVPGGYYASATHYGEMAYASGRFASNGDAQASLYVMRRITTSTGAWEDLYLDGSSTRLTIADGRTLSFDILVVGRSNAGESAGYYARGVVENVGGDITVWVATFEELADDDGNWSAHVQADDANDALLVQVLGNGETIRWVATVRTAEVAW